MRGRCFAQCDLSEQAAGDQVCGEMEIFKCRLGASTQEFGTGLCTYMSTFPVNTDKVRPA